MAVARVLSTLLKIRSPNKPLKSFHSCTLLLSQDAEKKESLEHRNEDNWEDVLPENRLKESEMNQAPAEGGQFGRSPQAPNFRSFSRHKMNETDSFSSPSSYSSRKYKETDSFSSPRSFSSRDYRKTDSFSSPRSFSSRDYRKTDSFSSPRSYNSRNASDGFDFDTPVDSPAFDPDIEKDVYKENPNTAKRSEGEIRKFFEDNNIRMIGSKDIKPILSFDELTGLEELQALIRRKGWNEPFPIQSVTWPVAMSGRDMVGIAKTGSGKTLGFVLPAILRVLKQRRSQNYSRISPTVLVMVPTRELTQQVQSVVREIAPEFGIKSGCAFGGASRHAQLNSLRGADICIATPGRLNDFLSAGQMSLNKCSYMVLDEADRMLDMGFERQIKQILRHVQPNRQMQMWSATWPREIQSLANTYLNNPVRIHVGSMELMTNPDINENFITSSGFQKFASLCNLLTDIATNHPNECKTLVFVNKKVTADELTSQLTSKGIPSFALHGDISQIHRDRVMDTFRRRKKILLIATDVASRGIDVADIANVVNYDMPSNAESYIHRVGRTARGGRKGKAFSFVTSNDFAVLKDLQKMYVRRNNPVPQQILDILGEDSPSRGFRSRGRMRYSSTPSFIDSRWQE